MRDPLLGGPFGTRLIRTDDVDEMSESLTAMFSEGRIAVDRPRGFLGEVEGFTVPDATTIRARFGDVVMRTRVAHVENYVALVVPVSGALTLSQRGVTHRVVGGRGAFLDAPGDDLWIHGEAGTTHLVIRVEMSTLHALGGRALSPHEAGLDEIAFDPVIDAAGAADALRHAQLLQAIGADTPEQVNPLAAALLNEQLATTLLLGQPNNWRDLLLRGTVRRETGRGAVREAAERMSREAGEPLTISRVARDARLSTRALNHGFHREFDCSPKEYLTRLRLDRARAELVAGHPAVTVAEIARRWGYEQPGRFAAAY